MKITKNADEYSLTVKRSEGTVVDFVVDPKGLCIGFTNQETEEHHNIVLSATEAQALRAHLNSTLTQQIFRQEQSSHIGTETAYMTAIRPLIVQ